MKHLWYLSVALALLVTGLWSLAPKKDGLYLADGLPAAGSVKAPEARSTAALAMAGLPNMVPAPAASRGVQALLSEEQTAEKARELSDSRYLDNAASLVKAESKTYDKREEYYRMRAVAFLANAAHWAGNPERERIFNLIDEALSKDNAITPEDVRQRKSMAGSKVELFDILLREAPERAHEIERRSAGTWLDPILRRSRARFEFYNRPELTASR